MKRVRFDKKLAVHIMTDWQQASQEARSTWMHKARSRRHFRKPIRNTALKIKWCLKPEQGDFIDSVHLYKLCFLIYHTNCMCLLFIARFTKKNQIHDDRFLLNLRPRQIVLHKTRYYENEIK